MNDVSDGAAVVARPSGASAHALIAREAQDVLVQMRCSREFPRDVVQARDRVINAFTRPGLCERALYTYARGGTEIQGLSIRAAEELARQWGNMRCGVVELSRAGGVSEVLAFAQDLETGFSDEKRFHVRHVRDTKQGQKPLTDDRDIYEHVANVAARRKRACILAVIPSDIAADAEHQIGVTLRTKVEVTADRIKAMLESFAELGVTTEAVEKRIQRRVSAMLPQQFLQLGRIYNSIQDGMSEPGDWFEIAPPAAEQPGKTDPPTGQAKPPESRTGELKEALRAQREKDTQGGGVMNSPAGAAQPAEARDPTHAAGSGPTPGPAADKGERTSSAPEVAAKAAAPEKATPAAASAPANALARKPAPQPEPAEAIPHFDERTAIAAIQSVKSLAQFKDITTQIGDDFRDTEREVPETVIEASEAMQAQLCTTMIQAATTLKTLNTAYDHVVASYGPHVPEPVVETFRVQQAKLEAAGR